MKVLGIIPARYASTRFPGKPLALIDGKAMIQHVYEGVKKISVLSDIVVATDDMRIANCVKTFGGKVAMTKETHRSGTDRCGEVLEQYQNEGKEYDVVINIQGDEPNVEHSQIETLVKCFEDTDVQIATLKKQIFLKDELFSPNVVKVVCEKNGEAIYFSRFAVPYMRGIEEKEWLQKQKYYKHIGVYAYRCDVLKKLVELKQTELEIAESLEQLRWIENGFKIRVEDTTIENIAIDTPEDLLKLKNK
ncbi:MAG: 3-deoxy-manno-octulosonate cytidylyltransferase [Bacteroidales bacterium]|nr:3-deoxy-manno-octulosonate cytidylyltransferase [Bacteroidales bacterium]